MCQDGVIKDNKVYLLGDDNNIRYPEEMFLAREECEDNLIQFEVDGKWGIANIYTGEIIIKPIWDYVGPFYRGYAHVSLGCELEINGRCYVSVNGGKHGYIDTKGKIVIPLDYDYAEEIPYRKYFQVSKDGKWGLIDNQNNILIPFKWDMLNTNYYDDLIFCAMEERCEKYVDSYDKLVAAICKMEPVPTCNYRYKWGVYDKHFNLIIEPELDKEPFNAKYRNSPRSKFSTDYKKYYILKKNKKYGLLCNDGRIIADIKLLKKQVRFMVNRISDRFEKDLYIPCY
jgi:hypothetical protein